MAYASWLTNVNPSSGSGNKTVTVTGSENTGRIARQTVLTITAAGVEDKTVTVMQNGTPEFVNQDNSAAVVKGGQTITIAGRSNSSKLTYSLGTGDLEVTLPENYTANGVSTSNGTDIVGDPGSTNTYDFSISFVVAANDTIEEHSKQLIVTDNGGHTAICTITQAAGDSTLTVSVETLEMNYKGDAVSFDITSNCNWTIA